MYMFLDAGSGMDSSNIHMSDLNDDTFRKSVLLNTSVRSNSSVYHAQRLVIPHVQQPRATHGSGNDDGVSDASDDHQYLWLPSRTHEQSEDRARVERYLQMDFTRNDWIYRIYTPIGGICIFLFFGILLFILSGALMFSSWRSFMQEIEYTDYGNAPMKFEIKQDLRAPVYFYYKVTDFYAVHKKVAYEASPSHVTSGKCKMFKTFKEILDLRCIDGKNTLNGIDHWCTIKDKEPLFQQHAYPCGAIAATVMTDNFSVCKDNRTLYNVGLPPPLENQYSRYAGTADATCLPLATEIPDYDHGFYHINQKKPPAGKGFQWMDLSSLMFRSWIQIPYDSSFLKPYAVLNRDLKAGTYYLHVTHNMWPAKEWKARKYVVIAKPGFLGTSARYFEIIAMAVATLFILTGIVLLIMYKSRFHCGVSPWRGVQVHAKKSVVNENPTGNFYRSEGPKPVENVVAATTECLCPLH
ncbi:hypothetical protein BaOVIS_032500 [Babesia ovis]|uniref:Uncharacterized protein n=1 Tax=Babesia ovis TaxID=5869 RepID=A0A9W5TDN6_BABOV|nr:hypothetical protein BaOVIS_032500 [Babesia ovis]